MSSSRGYFLLMGTNSSRKVLLGACNEIARETSTRLPSLLISGTIPEVLRVILLLDKPYAL